MIKMTTFITILTLVEPISADPDWSSLKDENDKCEIGCDCTCFPVTKPGNLMNLLVCCCDPLDPFPWHDWQAPNLQTSKRVA